MVHLPALNTPQFDWAQNHFSHRPSPPDPLYQPEVAARGIVFAIDHPRRDLYVGGTTVAALYAQRFLPGLTDRFLARSAWEGQLGEEREDPGRRSNLWDPRPGDHGARGRFGDRAVDGSAQLWVTTHRGELAAMAGGLAGLLLLLASRRHD